MKPINLTKTLKFYKSGWVALNKGYKVVAYAKTFDSITKKTSNKRDVLLIPAAKNYFGFITCSNG